MASAAGGRAILFITLFRIFFCALLYVLLDSYILFPISSKSDDMASRLFPHTKKKKGYTTAV
jgi:hypothetical protein